MQYMSLAVKCNLMWWLLFHTWTCYELVKLVFFSCVFSLQFDKPGARGDYDYPDMAKEAGAYLKRIWTLLSYSQNYRNTLWFVWSFSSIAGQKALADAGIPYSAIEQACVGYVYGNTVACKVEMLKAIITIFIHM